MARLSRHYSISSERLLETSDLSEHNVGSPSNSVQRSLVFVNAAMEAGAGLQCLVTLRFMLS